VLLLVCCDVNFPLWHSKVKELKLTLSRQVKFNIQIKDEAVKIGRNADWGLRPTGDSGVNCKASKA
jgi:hypothetical protein